jgi:hypothetical protein
MPTRPPNSPFASCKAAHSGCGGQNGVEIGCEVDRDPRAVGPRQIVDEFVAVLIRGPFCHEGVDAFASGPDPSFAPLP